MSVLLKHFLIVSVIFLICSCAASVESRNSTPTASPADESDLLAGAFAQQSECYSAWSHLVTDWEGNGGGFKESLLSTRKQILTDQVSAFAAITRDVWSAQKGGEELSNGFGRWPIGAANTMSVIIKPNDAISKTLNKYLPRDCEAFTWLYPVIWDRIHIVIDGKVRRQHFAEMPNGIVWDSYNTSRWMLYWLFIRAN